MSGITSYHAGLAAEGAVERHYTRAGHAIAARRWRGQGGEIDLIARDGDGLVFIEVKKSRSHDAAAQRVTQRQMERIALAASEFLSLMPRGQATPSRFDVALVDSLGRVAVLENAFAA